MESLKQYECPEWFRDAKFGIWAHWGPQAVPMDGDWYARGMYEPGNKHYKYHLEHYGHPSQFGYKDIIPLWKAEKWDPDRLMRLYKKAGAKYFVSMGSHHDNFFLWNSKLHKWNAVNMGPKRDVVGEWQKAAKKYGLRFGVSEHLGASFTWFQSSHRADKTARRPACLTTAPTRSTRTSIISPPNPATPAGTATIPNGSRQWYDEIKELVDNYHPDLLYTDGGVPFGNEVGLSMIAHFYNSNAALHGGKVEAVYNCKQKSEGRWVEDLERGVMPKIDPYPWQTDTSIGDWYYNRNWKFRPVSWVIHMLVDNVSKNGNLLLNIVQRPDGSLDPEVEADARAACPLERHPRRSDLRHAALAGLRRKRDQGEGRPLPGGFQVQRPGNPLHHQGTDALRHRARLAGRRQARDPLARQAGRREHQQYQRRQPARLRRQARMEADSRGPVRDAAAEGVSQYTAALKITGAELKNVPIASTTPAIRPDAKGKITLSADDAQIEGSKLAVEQHGGLPNLGFWDDPADYATWMVHFPAPGVYRVAGSFAAANGKSLLVVECMGRKLAASIPKTKSWDDFQEVDCGKLQIDKSGDAILTARPRDAESWKAINLRALKLAKRVE